MAKSIKLSNEVYLSDESVVHEQETLADLLFYKSGDTLENTNNTGIFGILNSGKKIFVLFITTPKLMTNIDTITLNSLEGAIRNGSTSATLSLTSDDVDTILKVSDNQIAIRTNLDSDFSVFNGNDVVVVSTTNISISFT